MLVYSKFLFQNVFSNLERQTVRNSIIYYFTKLSYKRNLSYYSKYKYEKNETNDIFKEILINTVNDYFSFKLNNTIVLDKNNIKESFVSFKENIKVDQKHNYSKYLLLLIDKYSYFRYIDFSKYWNIINLSEDQINNITELYIEELNKVKDSPELYLSDINLDILKNVIYEETFILSYKNKINQLNRFIVDNKDAIIPDLIYSGCSMFKESYKSTYIKDNGEFSYSKLFINGKESNPKLNKYSTINSIPTNKSLDSFYYNEDFILIPATYGNDIEKNKIVFDTGLETDNKDILFKFVLSTGKLDKSSYEQCVLKIEDINIILTFNSEINSMELRNLSTNEKIALGNYIQYNTLKPILIQLKENKLRVFIYETFSWSEFISYTNNKIYNIEFLNENDSDNKADKAFSLDIFMQKIEEDRLLSIINNNYYSDHNIESPLFSIENEDFLNTEYDININVNKEKYRNKLDNNKKLDIQNLNDSLINDFGYNKRKLFVGNHIDTFEIEFNNDIMTNSYSVIYRDYALSNGNSYGIKSRQYLFDLNGIFFKEYNNENLLNLNSLKFKTNFDGTEYILLNNLTEDSELFIFIEKSEAENEAIIKVLDKKTKQISINKVNILWKHLKKLSLKDNREMVSNSGYGKLFEIKLYSKSIIEYSPYIKFHINDKKPSLYREFSEDSNYKKIDNILTEDIFSSLTKETLIYLLEKDNILKILKNVRQDILSFIQDHIKIYNNKFKDNLPNLDTMKNVISNLFIGCNLLKMDSEFLLENDFEKVLYFYIKSNYIKNILNFYLNVNGEKLNLNNPDIIKNISFMFLSDIINEYYFKFINFDELNLFFFNKRELEQIYLRYDKSFDDEQNHFFEILRHFKNVMLYGKVDIISEKINNIFILDKIKDFSNEYADLNLYLYLLDTLEEDDPIIDDIYDKNCLIREHLKDINNLKEFLKTLSKYSIIDDNIITTDIESWDFKNNIEDLSNSLKIRRKMKLKEIIENMIKTFKQYRFINNGILDFDKVQLLIYRNLEQYKNNFDQNYFNNIKIKLNKFYDEVK